MRDLEQDLVDITRSVWKTTLGFDVAAFLEPPSPDAGPEICATVELRGAWSGSLSLHCPRDLARRAAAAFYGRSPAEVVDAELRDAVGELANMTGGNLKGLLPGPCVLSTPRAGESRPGALRLTFVCWPQFFAVELAKEEHS